MNDLLQGKVQYAVSDVGRFFVNTTVGIAGFFDPATSLGMELHWEDFGQTLGWWGVGTGPYLMLPILGPSDIRDGGGLIVDTASSITPFFVSSYYTLAARTRRHRQHPGRLCRHDPPGEGIFVRLLHLRAQRLPAAPGWPGQR